MMMRREQDGRRDVAAIALRYRNAVHAFFLRRIGDAAEAEDLTQDVFARLSQRANDDPVENVEGYVFQVAANLLRDRFRREQVRPDIGLEGFADPSGRLVDEISPEREAMGREDYQRFVEAMDMLPERLRTVFILNRFEDMSGREIAAALGLSQRQIEKDISRVLAHLREQMP